MLKLKDILKKDMSKEEFYEVVKLRKTSDCHLLEEKAEYICSKTPETKAKILSTADNALEGKLILPGTGAKYFYVGNPPDWYENKLNYNEYVWQLNRMYHWESLLQAYTITGEAKYAKKIVQELEDWILKCPRPSLVNNFEEAKKNYLKVDMWRSLEIGIRMFKSWPLILEHLMCTEFMTSELLEKYAISVYEHCEVLEEVCPILLPNADHNFYIMQNLGLLCAATMFPEFNKSDQWKKHAIRELERCAEVQLTDDGGHLEGCPLYHNGAIHQFGMAIMLLENTGCSFSDEFMRRVQMGVDYSIYSFRPNGEGVPWGDSRPNKEGITSAIYGYLAFKKIKWIQAIRNIMDKKDFENSFDKLMWSIKNPEEVWKSINENNDGNLSLGTLNWQHKLNQVAMRTDWTNTALSIFFGCNSPVINGHSHIDLMNIDFTALGKPLIVDPGRYSYAEGETRYAFKSSAYHNSLVIDDKDPFEYISGWSYGSQKLGYITNASMKEEVYFAEAVHYNYEPTIHKRMVGIVDNSFVIILDRVSDINKNSKVKLYYHLNSNNVRIDSINSVYTEDSDINVAIYTTDNLVASIIDGRISVVDDTYYDSKRIVFEDSCNDEDRFYVSILIPYRNHKINIKNIKVSEKFKETIISFEIEDKKYELVWNEGELIRLL